jgi:hypothetical protein
VADEQQPPQVIGNECPYCRAPMAVTRMACAGCRVSVEAAFPAARLGNLPVEHQRFIEMFVLAGGSLKALAEQTGVSYPTIRSRLDKVIDVLRAEIARTSTAKLKGTIFDAVGEGKMTPAEKANLIKGI